jgi:hypothetical protein
MGRKYTGSFEVAPVIPRNVSYLLKRHDCVLVSINVAIVLDKLLVLPRSSLVLTSDGCQSYSDRGARVNTISLRHDAAPGARLGFTRVQDLMIKLHLSKAKHFRISCDIMQLSPFIPVLD